MQRIGHFDKVSQGQYLTARGVAPGVDEATIEHLTKEWEHIPLPVRATVGSAGYDFKAPYGFILEPGSNITIPTGIRVKIDPGWFLACFPRSGLGFKYKIRFANTVGIIDQDYYYSSNEGHIMAKLCNEGNKTIEIKAGDGIFQGIFLPFGITYDDEVTATRDGGFGSTGR